MRRYFEKPTRCADKGGDSKPVTEQDVSVAEEGLRRVQSELIQRQKAAQRLRTSQVRSPSHNIAVQTNLRPSCSPKQTRRGSREWFLVLAGPVLH